MAHSLTSLIFAHLNAPPPTGIRSMVDAPLSALAALTILVRADKRMTTEIALDECFLLPARLARTTGAPTLPPHMMHPSIIELHALGGAAVEHHTLLGRVLRIGPDPMDPQINAMFGEAHRQPKSQLDNSFASLQGRMKNAQSSVVDVLMSSLKAGGTAKEAAMLWMTQCIALNKEAEKGHPSPLLASSPGFLINFGAVMMEVAKPVVTDLEKIKKVDWDYLGCKDCWEIFGQECTPLVSSSQLIFESSDSINLGDLGKELTPKQRIEFRSKNKKEVKISFITQSFFFCWRTMHLGVVQQCNQYQNTIRGLSHHQGGLQTNEPHAIHYLVRKLVADCTVMNRDYLNQTIQFFSAAAVALLHALTDTSSSSWSSSDWLLSPATLTPRQRDVLMVLPEHLVDDLMTILLTVGKTEPAVLANFALDSVLSLIVFFLRRPWSVTSPHLRAKLGQVLFQVFLPGSHRSRGDMWTNNTNLNNGPHNFLLDSHLESQQYLAPALLLLYGDVERTGFYEKLTNRRSIMIVLKHLWALPSHRSAFRGIASVSTSSRGEVSGGTASASSNPDGMEVIADSESVASAVDNNGLDNYFVRFANGESLFS